MKVDVTTGASFDAGTPEAQFTMTFSPLAIRTRYRLAPDGQHFLVLAPQGDQANPPTTILLNWNRLLER
jgi:hypothetical protein